MKTYTKRHMTKLSSGLALGLALSACGPSKTVVRDEPPTPPPAPVVAAPPPKPKPPPEIPLSEKIAKAKALYDNKDYAGARKAFEPILEKEPNNIELLFIVATSYDLEGDFDTATTAYQKVLAADPAHEGALLNLGKVYRRREKFDDAIALYTKALEADPENVKVRNNLGVVYRLAKKFDDAEKTLRRVLARRPGNVDAYKNMAVLFYDQDKLALAEQFTIEAKKLDEKDPGIWVNAGLIYFKKDGGKPTRAMGAFRKAHELDPNNVAANLNLAAIALRYRDYATAEKHAGKAVELEPNNFEAHLANAYALEGGKKNEQALASYDKVIALRGELCEVVFFKGMVFKGMQQWKNENEQMKKYKTLGCTDRLAKVEEEIKNSDYMINLPPSTPTPPPAAIGDPAATPAPAPTAPAADVVPATAPAEKPAEPTQPLNAAEPPATNEAVGAAGGP